MLLACLRALVVCTCVHMCVSVRCVCLRSQHTRYFCEFVSFTTTNIIWPENCFVSYVYMIHRCACATDATAVPWLNPTPNREQAYVKQEDVFYSQLTVRETLLMAARLRLPRSMSLDEKTAMVDKLISKLGLSKVYSTAELRRAYFPRVVPGMI